MFNYNSKGDLYVENQDLMEDTRSALKMLVVKYIAKRPLWKLCH